MAGKTSLHGHSPASESDRFERPIGLLGGIALVIGGVIGMGIYVLIAQVAAQVGTTLWLAFSVAILISSTGIVPLIQLSSALPRTGEVQTPLQLPEGCPEINLGDPVFFQHAKGGELSERFNEFLLIKDGKIAGTANTCRGDSFAFI